MNPHRFTDITADQIREAAKLGRWGTQDPVETICRGLIQIMGGFRTGYTVTTVLKELRLVGKRSGKPTRLGYLFLYDVCEGTDIMAALNRPTLPRRKTRA